ncbi:MAG: enoyl-ACP reductase [Planctomycetes bacterium]|nr:enoyl-ACP reductase [Planctomycetota bacterium]
MLLQDKRGIVFGIANRRSIAWAIAKAAAAEGARMVFTYQTERLGESVRELAATLPGETPCVECDLANDHAIDNAIQFTRERFGHLDFLVHAVAFARKEELEGDYMQTTREGFRLAHDISAYTFTAVAKAARPLFEGRSGSLITLTYMGAERVIPNYNVMGVAKAALEASVRYLANDLGPVNIRVNAISAGPIKTLAAAGISEFSKILDHHKSKAPMRKNTDVDEVADTAVFLLSEKSRGITGEVIHVDNGFHVLGV